MNDCKNRTHNSIQINQNCVRIDANVSPNENQIVKIELAMELSNYLFCKSRDHKQAIFTVDWTHSGKMWLIYRFLIIELPNKTFVELEKKSSFLLHAQLWVKLMQYEQ